MTKIFCFALLVCMPVFGIACGGNQSAPPAGTPSTTTSDSAPAAPSSSSASSASDVSQEGGPCSDDVAVQKKCAPGLVCGPPPANAPVSEHTAGVCKKP